MQNGSSSLRVTVLFSDRQETKCLIPCPTHRCVDALRLGAPIDILDCGILAAKVSKIINVLKIRTSACWETFHKVFSGPFA